jgi:hypothetical protein
MAACDLPVSFPGFPECVFIHARDHAPQLWVEALQSLQIHTHEPFRRQLTRFDPTR